MSRKIEFDPSFPSRINPHVELSKEIDLSSLTRNKLITRESSVNRYMEWKLADLTARFYPDADLTDLVVAVEQMAMFFFLDDVFDGEAGADPNVTNAMCRELAALVRITNLESSAQPTFPLARGWFDNWCKLMHGMSEDWRIRASTNLQQYFMSHVTEAVNRKSGKLLDMDGDLQVRRFSIGVQPALDVIERCNHFEVSPVIHQSLCMRKARTIATDVVLYVNELYSFEKDEANHEANNLIRILCRQRDLSVEQVSDELHRDVERLMREFLECTAEIDELCTELSFSSQQRDDVQRFLKGCRDIMRGNFEWSLITDRYSPVGAQQVKDNPYIDDAISRTGFKDVERKRREGTFF